MSDDITIRRFLPPAAFEPIWRHGQTQPARHNSPESPGWAESYRAFIANTVVPALAEHIKAVRDAGDLGPIPGTRGRDGRLIRAWRDAIEGRDEPYSGNITPFTIIAEKFAHAPIYDAIQKIGERNAPASMEDAYDRMTAKFDKGAFDWVDHMSTEHCSVTDDLLSFQSTGWDAPRLMTYDTKTKTFQQISDIEHEPIRHFEIDFEEEMLIADWFRIDAFTNAMKTEEVHSLNSQIGREESTLRHAALGVVHICVGNTSPAIVEKDGVVTVGWLDEDELDGRMPPIIGHVTTDLWWVTMVGRERLTSIIAEQTGRETAEKQVADYLADPRRCVSVYKTTPGRRHVYFTGRGDDDTHDDLFRSADFQSQEEMAPMFLISDRPLSFGMPPRSIEP